MFDYLTIDSMAYTSLKFLQLFYIITYKLYNVNRKLLKSVYNKKVLVYNVTYYIEYIILEWRFL